MSSVWYDPVLPKLQTPAPEFLKDHPVRFGKLDLELSQKQWNFTFARERFLAWVSGTRGGKSIAAVARSFKHTLFIPGNRGIIGRAALTDMEDTDQRDLYEYAEATGLVKSKNSHKLVMYCCDTEGNRLRGNPTSEIVTLHLSEEKHIKGHGIGWFHIAEASEVPAKTFHRLVDRLSCPAAAGNYTGFVTANSEGHNWIYDYWFNKSEVEKLPVSARKMRRGIHSTTKENPFVPPEYLEMQYATAPAEWIRRYMDASFDVFEGQIFSEFDNAVHYVDSRECRGWDRHEPPRHWPRTMGIDTGGADPWAFEASAVDPYGNLIFYDEIYRPESVVSNFEPDVRAIIDGRNFTAFPMDYENKTAMGEFLRLGIPVKNAFKRDKVKKSFALVWRYLHPNPQRAFPEWHPRAGKLGSPGIFFTERVPKMIQEIPQQRWKKIAGTEISLNEPDPNVADHATSALYYTLRQHPRPEQTLKAPGVMLKEAGLDAESALYWIRVKAEEQKQKNASNRNGLIPPFRVEHKGQERPIWR